MPDDPQAQKWLVQMEERGWISVSPIQEPLFNKIVPLQPEIIPSKPTSETPISQAGNTNRLLIGLALFLIIALQGAILFVLMSDKGPVEIKQPVSVQGIVSVEADENEEQTPGALAIEQSAQAWEYLTVNYSQIGYAGSEDFPLMEFVYSDDPVYDTALFGEYACDVGELGPECAAKFKGQAYYFDLWGRDGWEVISVIDKSTSDMYAVEMLLKRPKE